MITVYSKDACTKCKQAEMFLVLKGLEHEIKKLGADYELEFVKQLAPTQREFPVVVKDNILVGGLQELKELLKK